MNNSYTVNYYAVVFGARSMVGLPYVSDDGMEYHSLDQALETARNTLKNVTPAYLKEHQTYIDDLAKIEFAMIYHVLGLTNENNEIVYQSVYVQTVL